MPSSFSLTDLCGCGDDCADCCNLCCPGVSLPSTLYCTVVTTSGAHCEDGTTVTLTYNSGTGKWEGTTAFGSCGRDVTCKFYCDVLGSSCGDYKLDVSFSDTCVADFTLSALTSATGLASACSCDPFDIWFAKARGGGFSGDCSDGLGAGQTDYFEVTE